jgi:hypothetical protein
MDGLAVVLQQAGQSECAATLRDHGVTLSMLQDLYSKGRPRLLGDLKDLGVSKLASRQAIANALGKMQRSVSESVGDSESPSGPAPPGYLSVSLRMTGALGGDNCPLNGVLRNSVVYTQSRTVRELYDELQRDRGYAMGFESVRVSLAGSMMDAAQAAEAEIVDGMNLAFLGPNRGG